MVPAQRRWPRCRQDRVTGWSMLKKNGPYTKWMLFFHNFYGPRQCGIGNLPGTTINDHC